MRVLFLALMLCCCSAQAQHINDDVDRFTGARKMSYTQGNAMQFGVPILTVKAEGSGPDALAILQFMSSPELGRYARQSLELSGCRQVDWLIDGAPFPTGEANYRPSRSDRIVVEFVTQPVTVAQLERIGSGKSVEYRVCTKEGSLTATDINAISTIAARLLGKEIPAATSATVIGTNAMDGPSADDGAKPQPAMKYRPKVP